MIQLTMSGVLESPDVRQLDAVACALLERETLTGTDLAALLATR